MSYWIPAYAPIRDADPMDSFWYDAAEEECANLAIHRNDIGPGHRLINSVHPEGVFAQKFSPVIGLFYA